MNKYNKVFSTILILICFTMYPSNVIAVSQIHGDYITVRVDDRNNKKDEENKKEEKEVISITNEDLYLLSKLVSSEARGESYEGQVAVAAVVINRVKDPRFPDTVEGVIYQKNAFSVVNNGEIYMDPTDSSYKAAREALYGEDPTNGAIFFWNPDIATCNWIKTLDPYKRIGNHVFAK
ncbi:MAG: cell wall hydrolase [Paraclostridium sp.]